MTQTFLDGRHALVTGGGTGIGLAIAKALASAGAQVTITGRRAEVLQSVAAETPGLFAQQMDVSSEESVFGGVEAAVKARGPITIPVANAGIAEGASLAKTDYDFWRKILIPNLDGAYMTFRACLPGMREEGWGRGIAVSSIAGLKGLKGAPAYSASKHGMIGLIKSLAEDFATTELTWNAICPAYVDTNIVAENVTRISARAGVSEEQAMDIMLSANPHGRLISADEVAAAVLYLTGPHSGSVNGTTMEIAGGQI